MIRRIIPIRYETSRARKNLRKKYIVCINNLNKKKKKEIRCIILYFDYIFRIFFLSPRAINHGASKQKEEIYRSLDPFARGGRRDDKSDRWQQLVLGKLAGHCVGTCYFGKSSLGSLPANFGGPCARNYYLLPGSRTCRWPATLGIWNAVMDSLSGFLGASLIAMLFLLVSGNVRSFPRLHLIVFLQQFSTLRRETTFIWRKSTHFKDCYL